MTLPADLSARYRVERALGRGAQSTVYLARPVDRDEIVALKVVVGRDGRRPKPGAVGQMRSEIKMLRELAHPALPRVYELLELDDACCLVMEYVEGRTLEDLVRAEGAVDEALAVDWARQLGDALSYLHSRQPPVIFRDLKPANVILTPGGGLRLIDFGIAKLLDEKGGTQTTARGMVSRGYAAVEQYVGGTDERSDVYALGATLCFLVTGAVPPDAFEVATMKVPAVDPRTLRPSLDPRLAEAIMAMMQVDRSARPQSVAEAVTLL